MAQTATENGCLPLRWIGKSPMLVSRRALDAHCKPSSKANVPTTASVWQPLHDPCAEAHLCASRDNVFEQPIALCSHYTLPFRVLEIQTPLGLHDNVGRCLSSVSAGVQRSLRSDDIFHLISARMFGGVDTSSSDRWLETCDYISTFLWLLSTASSPPAPLRLRSLTAPSSHPRSSHQPQPQPQRSRRAPLALRIISARSPPAPLPRARAGPPPGIFFFM